MNAANWIALAAVLAPIVISVVVLAFKGFSALTNHDQRIEQLERADDKIDIRLADFGHSVNAMTAGLARLEGMVSALLQRKTDHE